MMVVVPNPNELKLIISIIIFEILSTLLYKLPPNLISLFSGCMVSGMYLCWAHE